MASDKRILIVVACILLICVGVSIFSGRIIESIYPPPVIQFSGFEGEIQPGGEATQSNFEKLRRGFRRHEVWSILGEATGSDGAEHWIEDWWDRPEFSIKVVYDGGKLTDGAMLFKGGKRIEMRE